MERAKDKLKGSVIMNIFSSKEDRLDEGLNLFEKALECYRKIENWMECGLTCLECSAVSELQDNQIKAIDYYIKAGKYFWRIKDNENALFAYKKAIDLCKGNNDFASVIL